MKFIKIFIALFFLAVVAVAGLSFWVFRSVNAAVAHSKANDYIRIEKGSTPREIITRLAADGIISSETATSIYLRTLGDSSNLQAGEYQFQSPISTIQVLKQLEKGEDRTIKLTIPEGFTRFDIAKRVAERFGKTSATSGLETPPMDDKAVLPLMDDISPIQDISPTAKNLEGYMYPTTYNFPRDAKPPEVIKRMVDEFRKFWKPEWTAQARSLGRTPHEIVTIASLIETETSVESERPIVAGVINNRLAKSIPLGIDQTNVYIAKMLGKWDGTIHKSDLEVDSPYNTRKVGGIPPGPISSVTESSISAALNPQPNDYIFYVLNVDANDGSHWFYASAAEFEKGKAKYQQWLEKERQEKREGNANQ
ncbi:MAG: endolytic transglycosylase MltG [Acidobacteria bacterium]|nr:endolytic transglycosylase MltG [Acidobacteriota bacterium]MBP7474500.1 endolytic transglycosylase MltG [Pyrinomonadaceae bacterium]